MGKKAHKRKAKDEPDVQAPAIIEEQPPEITELEEPEGEAEAEPGIESEEKPDHSVVAAKFKKKYIELAREKGLKGKAPRRSNWDWLSQEIAARCLDDKHKIRMDDFLAILEANGIDPSRWPNRNKGWEGRLRMTGRVVLQRIVADAGALAVPNGEPVKAPADWCEKHKTKE